MHSSAKVTSLSVTAYTVPTETFGTPMAESDGTAQWDSTGVVVVELEAGGARGLGYSYTSEAAFVVIRDVLAPIVVGSDALDRAKTFWDMARSVRNLGWPGVSAEAISAVDVALHDLTARILDVALVKLLGGARRAVTAYGSGGFTSYTVDQLQTQLAGWAEQGFSAVKMKIGSDPDQDVERVSAARAAIGDDIELFVDANGAYDRTQALGFADRFDRFGVTWFEEPVSSDDLEGLRFIRDRAPGGMRIAAGEYGYTQTYFNAMVKAGAVDTLQADATRCGGVTGFMDAASIAQAANIPLSAHTSPALHASIGAALVNVVNVEYFHDHSRIEDLFFEGVPIVDNGELVPDAERPGHGLELKVADARPYRVTEWRSNGSDG